MSLYVPNMLMRRPRLSVSFGVTRQLSWKYGSTILIAVVILRLRRGLRELADVPGQQIGEGVAGGHCGRGAEGERALIVSGAGLILLRGDHG